MRIGIVRRGLAVILTLALGACDDVGGGLLGNDQDRAEATQAVQSTDLSRLEAALLAAVADDVTLGQSAEQMATAAAAAAETTFTPANCVQAQTASGSVTYTFTNCSGPRGLSGLGGVANVVFTVEATDSTAMLLTATDLDVNSATMTIHADAAYSLTNGVRRVDLNTSGAGTNANSDILGRAGTYSSTFDDSCLTIDGTWTTSINDTNFFATSVEGYRRCGTSCPASGRVGYVGIATPETAADPLDGSGIVITFDGTSTARFVSPSPSTGTIPAC